MHCDSSTVALQQVVFSNNRPGSFVGTVEPAECDGGYFALPNGANRGNCAECPAGYYKDVNAATKIAVTCQACPAGQYGTKPKATSFALGCTSCPRGYFQSEQNAQSCNECPAGRYGQFEGTVDSNCTDACPEALRASCTAGTASPRAPKLGHYLADVATKLQRECPAGKYKEALSFEACLTCPAGKYSGNSKSTFCALCAAGKYVTTSGSANVTACVNCDKGRYGEVAGGSSLAAACIKCEVGKHSSTMGRTYRSECAAGSITDTGTRVGAKACTPCRAGKYSTASSVASCTDCGTGQYQSDGGKSYCSECAAGSITNTGTSVGAKTCTPCVTGKYSAASNVASCTECTAGSVTNTGTGTGASTCTECAAGKYSTASAAASCIACETNKYQNSSKQTSCIACAKCPAGERQSCAKSFAGFCTDCSPGRFVDASKSGACTVCPAGKYQNRTNEASCIVCAKCPAGERQSCAKSFDGFCTNCLPGTHADSSTKTCKACPAGQSSSAINAPRCDACAAGQYQEDNGSSICLPCQAGSITDTGTSVGAKACTACAAGKYSAASNVASCTECTAGSVTNTGTGTGASTCTECAAGKYSTASAAASCIACETNKYQNSSKQTSCIACAKCPAGERQGCSKSAEGYCVDCTPGRFVDASKSGACTVCPAGKYQNRTNEASCITCGSCSIGGRQGCKAASEGICSVCYPGRYLADGQCKDCKQHQFQPKRNQPKCIECPRGKYQNMLGQVFCEETPAGQMAIRGVDGRYSTSDCPAGQFSSTSSVLGCQQCEQGKVQPKPNQPVCERCAGKQYIWRDPVTRELDGKHCDNCPQPGASCDGTNKTYDGDHWHDPNVTHPGHSAPGLPRRPGDAKPTKMYACVNDGCPDKGATVMQCKRGYHGPLCAVCNDGFFLQLRSCTDCEGSGPGAATIVLFVVSLLFIIGLAAAVVRHRRFLASAEVFAHIKILVAFVTIMLSVDRQFGVTWPAAFQRALAALSILSLDFGVLTSLLCIVRLSFYANLLCTTLLLVLFLVVVYMAYALMQHRHHQATSAHPPDHPETLAKAAELRQNALFVGVYLLAFAYPVVSVKVVALFGCHNVEGTYYLRADYSLECYTSEWTAMAVYASVFLAAYVVGFPLFVGAKLWSYRHELRRQVQGPGQVCKLAPKGLLLGFLLDDYVLKLPCFMWETEEMGRKLILSVVGNFWSDKSVMSIGTALIISLVFQLLHTHYKPFKSPACNRLQQICMSVDNAVYIVGLLVKTQATGETEERDLGVLLVGLLVTTVVAVSTAVVLEIRELLRAMTRTRRLTALLRKLPQQDPPDGSSAFYDIQIPVEENNMGNVFKPKTPEALAGISNDSKLAVVRQLSEENEQLLEAFLYRVSHASMIPLQQVRAPMLVKREGQMCVEWGRKTEAGIVKKACRPEIRKKHPEFNIEHVRDTFRFRATLYSFRDIVEFILAMHGDPSLSGQSGLTPGNVDNEGNWLILGETASSTDQSVWSSRSGRSLRTAGNVAKLDIKKLVKPRKTGWRFMALDFFMPNHQIVEVRCSAFLALRQSLIDLCLLPSSCHFSVTSNSTR